MLKPADITLEKIEEGFFEKELPEFYALKNVIENNIGHVNDPVFHHSIESVEALEKLLAIASSAAQKSLDEVIGGLRRREILFLATLFHDIGKLTDVPDTNGMFLNHNLTGAELVQTTILKQIALEPLAQIRFVELIANHLLLHEISNNKEHVDELFEKFLADYSDIALELTLLVLADLRGSNLPELNPALFAFKDRLFKNKLENWAL